MRTATARSVLEFILPALALVAATAAPRDCPAGQLHKGVSLTLWDRDIDLQKLSASLDDLAAIGVDRVAVNVWWFQDDIHSMVIAPDFTRYSASDDSVRAAIDAVHARGMKVMLKPLVDLSDDPGHWRGQIAGGSAWFGAPNGYNDFIQHFAGIAQDEDVEVFCVGTELVATVGQEADWRALIGSVRAGFSGELTYAANHGGASAVTAATINWWDELDYFGLDAYYPLTGSTDPSPGLEGAARVFKADQIEGWRNGIDPAKSVLFTEIGYRSWDGANMAPWSGVDKGDTDVDEQEQADCYEALFSGLWGKREWLEGLYWWNWEVDPDPIWEADNWYTPQGKPAQSALQTYYSPLPGDANFDGAVDGADYTAWADHYGHTDANWPKGDFTGDGLADGADYTLWADNYTGDGSAVPGPAALSLLTVGGLALIRRRRECRHCARRATTWEKRARGEKHATDRPDPPYREMDSTTPGPHGVDRVGHLRLVRNHLAVAAGRART